MTEEWLSKAVARSIQRELKVRAVSVIRFDPTRSNSPHELVFLQTAKVSEPSNNRWDRLREEKYRYEQTWGLTGTVFLNRKVIHAPLYKFKVSGSAKTANETSHEEFGHDGYIEVFEKWFNEPLSHILIIPIYRSARSLGAIKILNRLDRNGTLISGRSAFEIEEQAFCEGQARMLARVWDKGLKLGAQVEKRVMVSYAHQDTALCDFIAGSIKKAIPEVAVLRDSDLRVGAPWRPEIHDIIASCQVAVFVLTKRAVKSKWVREEWVAARKDSDRMIIAVVDESAQRKAFERFPGLRKLKFLRFFADGYYAIERDLIRAVREAL